MTKGTTSLVLAVLDGWGDAPPGLYNAIHVANTPILDRLKTTYPYTTLAAHGPKVGLPKGQMGNSEVGHLNLGAGRVVKQDLVTIDGAVADGSFARNPVFLEAAKNIKTQNGKAHIMGLCSPGGVHSSLEHLYALVDLLAGQGLEVRLHAILDGRDTPPTSAGGYLKEIEKQIAGKAEVAVVVGRFYSMDRDKRWDRVEKGFNAHVLAEGIFQRSVDEAIASAYESGETDEFVTPRIIVDDNRLPKGKIEDGDGVFFFNFRADRAREMTLALTDASFSEFDRAAFPRLSSYVCMTEYSSDFGLRAAFAPVQLTNILGEVLSKRGLKQFRSAETEKYAHVTFFFNGGVEAPLKNEDRQLIPSPKDVPTYDKKPEMSAQQVADVVVEQIMSQTYDFVLVNFANGDMVGHTGILEATIKAVETVDKQIGRLLEAIQRVGGSLIVTADHGNSEQMRDEDTGEPYTAHTNNPVPFILVDEAHRHQTLRPGGALCDVAPTVLKLLDIPQPADMTGRSLIE